MSQPVRKECLKCKTHTYRERCGNCGSDALRPVAPGPFDASRASAGADQRRRAASCTGR